MNDFLKRLFSFFRAVKSGEIKSTKATDRDTMAQQLIVAFGGESNIDHIDACITRLRIEVSDTNKVDREKLIALGAAGVIAAGNNMQAIFGPRSEALMRDMQEYMTHTEAERGADEESLSSDIGHQTKENTVKSYGPDTAQKSTRWIKYLGGAINIISVESCALTRIRLKLEDSRKIDEKALKDAGIEAVVHIDDHTIHLLVGLDADHYAAGIDAIIRNT